MPLPSPHLQRDENVQLTPSIKVQKNPKHNNKQQEQKNHPILGHIPDLDNRSSSLLNNDRGKKKPKRVLKHFFIKKDTNKTMSPDHAWHSEVRLGGRM